MGNEVTSYKQAAQDAFTDLLGPNGAYLMSTNFWQNGNVADTLIDYLQMAISEPDPNFRMPLATAQGYIKTIYDHYYATLKNDAGCWYDDFGWWGITGAKAYNSTYTALFGSYLNEFKKIAIDNWNVMQYGKSNNFNYGAPNVWAKCDKTLFAGVAPKYDRGVWQYDIYACPKNDCSPSNPSTPIKVKCPGNGATYEAAVLGPYQLSVVNGLYLVLATRLAAAGVIKYDFANDEFAFIYEWCNVETGADTSLLNRFGTIDQGIIRERVSMYANGSKVNYYYPDNAWTGDQGLFLGGLLDYAMSVNWPNALYLAQKILLGVPQQMQQMPTTDGKYTIIAGYVPYGADQQPWSGDPGDYSSGLGVFMRYLYYSYGRGSAPVRQIINSPGYRDAISKAANAARDNTIPTDGASAVFIPFNRLATLMMGIALGMSTDEETVTGTATESVEEVG